MLSLRARFAFGVRSRHEPKVYQAGILARMTKPGFSASGPRLLLEPFATFLTFVGECTILLFESAIRLFRRPFEFGEFLAQMAQIGVASVPIVALTTFSSGAVLALYTTEVLVQYGATSLAGGTIALAVTREIAPVLAGVMVAARSGSAMAAQIGTMKVTEQIDALRVLNVHPTNYLVIPRLLAAIIMLPVLDMLGCYSAVFGGYLVSIQGGVASGSFMQSIQQWIEPWDFVAGMIKTTFFGLIIGLVATQQGLRTKDGAVGVGRATTNAVVISMVLIYVVDYFVSDWLY